MQDWMMGNGHDGSPAVSVILTTRDRPRFLTVALACYGHQTYTPRELIVVDDGDRNPADPAAVAAAGGRLIRVEPGTPLGAKLNRGVEAARGPLCQKMDDDDWYAPEFLETMIAARLANSRVACHRAISFLMPFLFFDVASWEVRPSVPNNAPGATLLFAREDWEERPFRGVVCDEDVWFILDQIAAGTTFQPVQRPEVFLAVRHGSTGDRGHTWTNYGAEAMEQYLHGLPLHESGPEAFLPQWALDIYRDLHRELAGEGGPAPAPRAGSAAFTLPA